MYHIAITKGVVLRSILHIILLTFPYILAFPCIQVYHQHDISTGRCICLYINNMTLILLSNYQTIYQCSFTTKNICLE